MDDHFLNRGGRWKTLPFQREIADAMSDPEIERVSVIKSARVGFTQLLVGYLCYRAAHDPGRVIVVQSSQEEAEGFSKEDLAPALESIPEVVAALPEPRARNSSSTILHKALAGDGFIRIGGAHSGRIFRRVSPDAAILDEVDSYPLSAGGEGAQIELASRRLQNATFPKLILGSSPKLAVESRIDRQWEESDQRDFVVPCPHCDHGQRLRWGGKNADFGIKWPPGQPREAYYLCEHCHAEIAHHEKNAMVAQGRYVAGRPEVENHAGFRIWAGYSPFRKAAWSVLAAENIAAKGDPFKVQVFVNTALGESYTSPTESPVSEHELKARAEARRSEWELPEGASVPAGVGILTAFADVQGDRIEWEVVGWGRGEESWSIAYGRIYGDIRIHRDQVLGEYQRQVLGRPWVNARGVALYIRAAGIDAGYAQTPVVHWCRSRRYRIMPSGFPQWVFATKGSADPKTTTWPPERMSKSRIRSPKPWIIGVNAAKDQVYGRLGEEKPGPGYCHFRPDYELGYFEGLTAEHAKLHYRYGQPYRLWEKKHPSRVNEPLDCRVGAYAMIVALQTPSFGGIHLDQVCEAIEKAKPTALGSAAGRAAPPQDQGSHPRQGRRPRVRARGWGWD